MGKKSSLSFGQSRPVIFFKTIGDGFKTIEMIFKIISDDFKTIDNEFSQTAYRLQPTLYTTQLLSRKTDRKRG